MPQRSLSWPQSSHNSLYTSRMITCRHPLPHPNPANRMGTLASFPPSPFLIHFLLSRLNRVQINEHSHPRWTSQ